MNYYRTICGEAMKTKENKSPDKTKENKLQNTFTNTQMKKRSNYRWRDRRFLFASVVLLLLIFTGQAFGQGEANVWYFGEKIGIDFNSGSPVTLCDGAQTTCNYEGEGYATISNSSGSLLFYTNGVTVWDRAHTAMTNGTGLYGHLSSNQSATIVPMPGSTTKYYIFTVPAVEGSTGGGNNDPQAGLCYSIVDMSLRSGYGDVVAASKNTRLTPANTAVMEAQTIVPHSNGTDWWILAHGAGNRTSGAASNTFYAFQVSSSGISAATTSSVGYAVAGCVPATCGGSGVSNSIGAMKSNSCFTKLAMSFYGQGASVGSVQVFPFDNSSGSVSAPSHTITNFNNRNEVYSLDFSPNGDYLFVSELTTNYLFQFDLTNAANVNTAGARTTLANTGYPNVAAPVAPDPNRTGAVQLGPDGNIYVARHRNWCASAITSYVGQITNPNAFPATYNATAVSYSCGGWVSHGLPQFAKSFVGSSISASVDKTIGCTGDNFTFKYTFSGIRSSVLWDFGDGTTSTSDIGVHSYSSSGTKTIKLTVTDVCGRQWKDQLTVTILDGILPTGNVSCSSPSITLNGTGVNAANYIWYDAATGGNIVGTGATVTKTYTPLSSTPTSFWIEDATGTSSYGPLQTHTNSQSYSAVQNSSFTTYKPLTLSSVQVEMFCGFCPGTNNLNVTVTLGTQSKSFIYSGNSDVGTVLTLPLNFALPTPGTYTISVNSTSNPAFYNEDFSAITGGTIAGVATFNVSPDNASKTGPFFNFMFKDLNPCKSRVQVDRTCALPVELLSFEGNYTQEGVTLHWITVMEMNNNYFLVQRSTDGVNYSTIGKVKGAGTTYNPSSYTLTDADAPDGIVYYRLLQYDFDGTEKISAIVKVASRFSETLELTAYPNPFTQASMVTVKGKESLVQLKVMDLNGKVLIEDKYFKTNQATEIGADLASGVYIIQATGVAETKNFKLIKE